MGLMGLVIKLSLVGTGLLSLVFLSAGIHHNLNKTNSPSEISKPAAISPQIDTISTFQSTPDPDPLVTCNIHTACGGSRQMRQSDCKSRSFCCYNRADKSQTKLVADQKECDTTFPASIDPDPIIDCKGQHVTWRVKSSVCSNSTECPNGYGGYDLVSSDTCKKRFEVWGQQLLDSTKQYINTLNSQQQAYSQYLLEQQRLENERILTEEQQKIQDLVNSVPPLELKADPLPTLSNTNDGRMSGDFSSCRDDGNGTTQSCWDARNGVWATRPK